MGMFDRIALRRQLLALPTFLGITSGLPTIRSGCKIDIDALFKTLSSIRSINRDFHTREAQFTAMEVRGTGSRIQNNGEYEQTV